MWAPNAIAVSVMGDFNGWDPSDQPLAPRASSGIWEGVVDCAAPGDVYKFAITTTDGTVLEKADPFAHCTEIPPRTGSVVWDLSYEWRDEEWMRTRAARCRLDAPISVYEVHLGSWRRDPNDPARFLTYRELAQPLIEHVRECGFTHVEFLPLMEHPFYGSWGYQTTGFFAPTRRYGDPQDLMFLIDELHHADIGVIFDWVPSHFPADAFALAEFDGTHLFEHADVRLGFHPDWKSLIFNYGRHEVRSFLASSAEHWLSTYHVDALRVDAVASMLYLDYSRRPGEWLPNAFGGRENLDAIEFLRQLNIGIYAEHPDVQVIAEESTAFPGVSRPVDAGGIGFGLKWDMGWMHDTLDYLSRDPIHRGHHQGELTFRAVYAFSENFLLPLSHDEVVYGKGSLLTKMPGDDWQKFADAAPLVRLSVRPTRQEAGLHGRRIRPASRVGTRRLARLGRPERPRSRRNTAMDGRSQSGVPRAARAARAGLRSARLRVDPTERRRHEPAQLPSVFERRALRCSSCATSRRCRATTCLAGVPVGGYWREILNSDAEIYGGSGIGNLGGVEARPIPAFGMARTLTLTVPPLGCLFMEPE